MSALRQAIRTRLAPLHEKLDRAVSARVMGTGFDLPTLLQLHARVLPAADAALQSFGVTALYPDWDGQARIDLLHADLAAFGQSPPLPVPTPALANESQAAGMLYALEGSSLGNQMLARQARSTDDPRDRAATRYLDHGGQTGAWPRYTAWLAAHEAALALDPMVEGAETVFQLYLHVADAI